MLTVNMFSFCKVSYTVAVYSSMNKLLYGYVKPHTYVHQGDIMVL